MNAAKCHIFKHCVLNYWHVHKKSKRNALLNK